MASTGLARAEQPDASAQKNTRPAILAAVIQNTRGYSEGFPAGVPRRYAWCSGSYRPEHGATPPAGFTSVTGWAQVYPKAGASPHPDSNASILVANARTYVHRHDTNKWVLVQDQAGDEFAGAHFVADLAGNEATDLDITAQPDGSAAIGVPPPAHNDVIWLTRRGEYEAGSVDGVYVQMDMKTSDPGLKLVANVGADWWRDPVVEYVKGSVNNPGAGMSNWVELTDKWSTLHFYSRKTASFWADPPPPLADTARAASPDLPAPARKASICPAQETPVRRASNHGGDQE